MTRPWCPPPWRPGAPAVLAELEALLRDLRFRPGWEFHLMTYGHETMLAVDLECVDTYDPPTPARVGHRFAVPVVPMRRHEWRRWLLERIGDVDRHEACEWFQERVPDPLASVAAWLTAAPDPAAPPAREEWVRPFDPHHDAMTPAYRVVDWTVEP